METRINKGSKFIGLTPKQVFKKYGIKILVIHRSSFEFSSQNIVLQKGDYIETQQLRKPKKK